MIKMKTSVLKERLAVLLDKINGEKLTSIGTVEDLLSELDIYTSVILHDLESVKRELNELRK